MQEKGVNILDSNNIFFLLGVLFIPPLTIPSIPSLSLITPYPYRQQSSIIPISCISIPSQPNNHHQPGTNSIALHLPYCQPLTPPVSYYHPILLLPHASYTFLFHPLKPKIYHQLLYTVPNPTNSITSPTYTSHPTPHDP